MAYACARLNVVLNFLRKSPLQPEPLPGFVGDLLLVRGGVGRAGIVLRVAAARYGTPTAGGARNQNAAFGE